MGQREWGVVALVVAVCLGACSGPSRPAGVAPPQASTAVPAPERRVVKPVLVLQEGHETQKIRFSPDGRRLVTAVLDVKVWDAATGDLVATLDVGRLVGDAMYSPDGQRILAGTDTVIRVWDAESGKLIQDHPTQQDRVSDLTFTPDGQLLASAAWDGTIKVWNAHSMELIRVHKCDQVAPGHAVYSPDGSLLLGGCLNTKVWDARTGKEQPRPFSVPQPLAFSPDAATMVAGPGDELSRIELSTGKDIWGQKVTPGWSVSSASFSSDGTRLVVGGDGGILVVDAAAGNVLQTLAEGEGQHDVAYSPDGKRIASAGWPAPDGMKLQARQEIWDAQSGTRLATLGQSAQPPLDLVATPDGKRMFVTHQDETLVWDLERGRPIQTLASGGAPVATTSDGAQIALRSRGASEVHDLHSGRMRYSLHHEGMGWGGTIALHPKGRLVASCDDRDLLLIDTTERTEVGGIQLDHTVRAIDFSPDGRFLVIAHGSEVETWDEKGTARQHEMRGHASEVLVARYSPGGQQVVTGGRDRSVRVWDTVTGRVLHTLRGHEHPVTAVAFTHDRSRLLSADEGGVIRVWKRDSGALLQTLRGAPSGIRGLVVPKSDSVVIAGTHSGLLAQRLKDGAKLWLHAETRHEAPYGILFTSEGLFSGDAQLFERVKFRMGGIHTGTLVTADHLFDRYYDEQLFSTYLRGASLEPRPDVRDGVGRPPRVEVSGLPRRTSNRTLSMTVRTQDAGGGIAEVRVYVNGARLGGRTTRGLELTPSEQTETRGEVTHQVQLELNPGDNLIEVEAYGVVGRVRSQRLRHRVELVGHDPRRPALFFVGLGIEQYEDRTLTLEYPIDDVRAVAAAFRKQRGRLYRDVIVELLENERVQSQPVATAIERVVAKSRPEDVFVLYAAGHGYAAQCGEQSEAHYLYLGYRATLRDRKVLCSHSFADDDLGRMVRPIPARKKVIVLDTCQAGAAATERLLVGMRGARDVEAITRLARAEGVAVIAAAQAEEYAAELRNLGHGLFTHAFLQGLEQATLRDDDVVTISSLISYISAEVPSLSRRHVGTPQYPIRSLQGDDFPIALAR